MASKVRVIEFTYRGIAEGDSAIQLLAKRWTLGSSLGGATYAWDDI